MKKSMRMLFLLPAIIAALFSTGCPSSVVDEEVIKNILYAQEFYGEWLFEAELPESGTDKLTITSSAILQETDYHTETGSTVGTIRMNITSYDQVNNHILATVVSSSGDYTSWVGSGDTMYGTYIISDPGVAVLNLSFSPTTYPAPAGLFGPYDKQ